MGLFGKKQFQTVEGAMEFLVDRLAVEAEMQGYPLNEHERKALRYAADEPSTEWGIDWEKVRGSDNEGTEFESKMTELYCVLHTSVTRTLARTLADTNLPCK